jgi:O-antigen ligase
MVLLRLLLLITLVCAGLMVAQYALGSSVNLLLTGRVETLVTQDTKYENVTRILPPAQSIVFMGFLILMVMLILRPFTRWSLLAMSFAFLCAGAVIVTFNRNFWVSGMLVIAMTGVLCYWHNPKAFKRVFIICGIAIGVLIAIPILMPGSGAAGLIQASAERIGSIASSEQVENDQSLRWRDTEYEYAVPAFLANPIIGVGPGGIYRPFDSRLDTEGRFVGTRYMHNGHLWLLVKGGIFSYGAFQLAFILMIYRGYRFWRFIPDLTLRSVVLTNSLILLVLPMQAIVAPIYTQIYWIPVLSIMMGVNEVIYRLSGLTR